MMLLRLSTLATGRTGVRPTTATNYVGMLDAGITPVVREYGCLGCSGDLAPLAHCALALMGEGEVRVRRTGRRRRPRGAGRGGYRTGRAGREGGPGPHQRHRRDARHAVLALRTTWGCCCAAADVAAAMSVEALLGTDRVFADDLQALAAPPRPGRVGRQPATAAGRVGASSRATAAAGLHPRPGRVLAALRAPGARRSPGHAGTRRSGRRPRAGGSRSTTRSSPSTGGSSPTATSTAPRSATCSTSSRSRPPTSRA